MPVKNYYTLNGEIIGERTVGGARTDYLTDALGSVTATVDSNAQVVNTYRYKPYGTQLAKTGAGVDPKFRWVGSQGYRQTEVKASDVYVRGRHYLRGLGLWSSVDILRYVRAGSSHYAYASASPTTAIDPTGRFQTFGCGLDEIKAIEGACEMLKSIVSNPQLVESVSTCMIGFGFTGDNNSALGYLAALCNENARICIFCLGGSGTGRPDILPSQLPAECQDFWDLCKVSQGQTFSTQGDGNEGLRQDTKMYPAFDYVTRKPVGEGLETTCRPGDAPATAIEKCKKALLVAGKLECDCISCLNFTSDAHGLGRAERVGPGNVPGTIAHEFFHCSGLMHDVSLEGKDYIFALGCCLCRARFGQNAAACLIPCAPVKRP